jgi:hypothetical protein
VREKAQRVSVPALAPAAAVECGKGVSAQMWWRWFALTVVSAILLVAVNAEASGPLTFTISLPKAQFSSVEPIPLTMTLGNASSAPLTVNGRLAVNDKAAPAAFREVTLRITKVPSGDEAPFRWLIKIGFPAPEDFTQLAPAEAVQTAVDIADLYGLDPQGEYQVCGTYQNTLPGPLVYDPGLDDFVQQDIGAVIATVDSNCLSFAILPVGGVTELRAGGPDAPASAAEGSGSSAPLAALAGGLAAAALALAAAAWYARKALRQRRVRS